MKKMPNETDFAFAQRKADWINDRNDLCKKVRDENPTNRELLRRFDSETYQLRRDLDI